MSKNSKKAYERVKEHLEVNGKVSYQAYYSAQSEESEEVSSSEASSQDDDNTSVTRWCTARKKTQIRGYSDAKAYLGLRYAKKNKGGPDESGVITSVV